jgi:hypothetical protein
MKLRNKKTGEVVDAWPFYDRTQDMNLKYYASTGIVNLKYDTLAKLNEEWEDYKPSEPLIKDKKIRKAVRAWWECISNNVIDKRIFYKANHDLAIGIYTIYCGAILPVGTLEEGKNYTIAELCGEEEE